jgi:REP element-mobilizing transposase RayT
MAEQLKISVPEETSLITTRTINSKLWFVSATRFQQEILGYLAKYQTLYSVTIYHFILMGNHYHLVAKFPKDNRHKFMQAFNKIFSNAARRHIPGYKGGPIWARRYRPQALPRKEDIFNWFFYSALNPISTGLVSKLSEYNLYNGFADAISGKPRKCKLVNWVKYQNEKRSNKELTVDDCTQYFELKYSRLPGFEDVNKIYYQAIMDMEYQCRRKKLLEKYRAIGNGPIYRKATKTGSYPKKTKVSRRYDYRPLVLSLCKLTKSNYLSWYFCECEKHRLASKKYLAGDEAVEFPPGTFKPTKPIPSKK